MLITLHLWCMLCTVIRPRIHEMRKDHLHILKKSPRSAHAHLPIQKKHGRNNVARNQSLNPLKISNTPPLTSPLPFCVRMPLSYFEIWTDTMKMIFYLYIRKNAAYSVVECEGWAVWPGARRPERATLAGYAPKVSFLSRYSERCPSAISLLYSETTKVFKQCHDNGNYYYYPTHTNGKITTNIKKYITQHHQSHTLQIIIILRYQETTRPCEIDTTRIQMNPLRGIRYPDKKTTRLRLLFLWQ